MEWKTAIKNNAPGLILGSIITVIAGWYFSYHASIPMFAVSHPELLARITDDNPDLKLLWKEKEISNLRSIKILIWNEGNKHIDKKDISTTSPIKITYPKNVKILFPVIEKTSREKLDFDLKLRGEEISISIKDDEALEKDDGVMVRILFTGESGNDFKVQGRIKGVKEGFEKVQWKDVSISKPTAIKTIITIVFYIGSIWFSIYLLSLAVEEYKKKGVIMENIIPVGFVLLIAFGVLYLVFNITLTLFISLPWAA